MKKKKISIAEQRKEQLGAQKVDPVGLARNVLLLPRGTAVLDLIMFFRETLSLPAESENWRFALSSYKPGLSDACLELAQAFRGLDLAPRRWVTALVDVEVGKAQGVDLFNAGYGGYPLFSEWAHAVRSAAQSGAESIEPDEGYPLLGLFGQDGYIDLVETMRHYEMFYLDAVETLDLTGSAGVPSAADVCFKERIPFLDPDLIDSSKAEKKLSIVTKGFWSANTAMREILAPRFAEQYTALFRQEKSTGAKTYRSAIIQATALHNVIYNLIETLTKRPRAIRETPLAERPPLSWTALAYELQSSGVPGEVGQSLLHAYHALEHKVGAEQAVQTARKRTVRLLDNDEVRKLDVCQEESPDDIETWAKGRRNERTWEQNVLEQGAVRIISPLELRDRIAELLDAVSSERTSFLIKRQKRILAALVLPPEDVAPLKSQIITARYLIENRKLLDAVAQGERFWISRRNDIAAVLIPPPSSAGRYLSAHEKQRVEKERQAVRKVMTSNRSANETSHQSTEKEPKKAHISSRRT